MVGASLPKRAYGGVIVSNLGRFPTCRKLSWGTRTEEGHKRSCLERQRHTYEPEMSPSKTGDQISTKIRRNFVRQVDGSIIKVWVVI